ncbi:hypothetical protein PanWU01x14_106200 [Parasponia andersonii]|uniref:Uncharacterized protein n=1 Tax=Parasponia andersonii TaxID=3476 RepID=A0A2P5D171_PARAD|nr:hypothetical protein PanWU01x14_106200 [Parasponia andersonii]
MIAILQKKSRSPKPSNFQMILNAYLFSIIRPHIRFKFYDKFLSIDSFGLATTNLLKEFYYQLKSSLMERSKYHDNKVRLLMEALFSSEKTNIVKHTRSFKILKILIV